MTETLSEGQIINGPSNLFYRGIEIRFNARRSVTKRTNTNKKATLQDSGNQRQTKPSSHFLPDEMNGEFFS
jgi:hypothetical protein